MVSVRNGIDRLISELLDLDGIGKCEMLVGVRGKNWVGFLGLEYVELMR